MPLAGGRQAALQIPEVTTSQSSTGELEQSFNYSSAPVLRARFVDKGMNPVQLPSGQFINVDAVAYLLHGDGNAQPLAMKYDTTGQRRQVKINGMLWEVLYVRDLAALGRVKEINLKAWQ